MGAWLARDADAAVQQGHLGDAIAGKPAPTGLCVGHKKPGGFGPPGSGEGYRCDSAYSARIERGTPCRVMCTPLGKSLKRSVR
ncbi:hypothetical protein EI534_15465 [Pseudomonas frederiksbergensis]|nr:hypothetical protein [Pseudomonas frederiksbergensis]